MNKVACLIGGVCLLVVGQVAWAGSNVWMGANTASGGAADTNANTAALWSSNWVPTSVDTAVFTFTTSNAPTVFVDAASSFAPTSLVFNGGQRSCWLAINKSLTLSNLVVGVANVDTLSGTLYYENNRLRIGTLTENSVALTLTGNGEPLNISGNPKGAWNNFAVGKTNVLIDVTGTDITFSRGAQYKTLGGTIQGGVAFENPTCTSNSTLRFSGDGATITLQDQGNRGATLGCGYLNLEVRTNQTWNFESTSNSAVAMNFRFGAATPSAGPDIIRSLDGGRLDNLGKVDIGISCPDNGNITDGVVRGMRLVGGTYGCIRMAALVSSGNANSQNHILQKGEVTLKGTSDYSLMLEGSASGTRRATMGFWTQGYNLSLDRGLYMMDNYPAFTALGAANSIGRVQLVATGVTVTVGGNLVIESTFNPTDVATTGNVGRTYGIYGDADTVLNLKGSYSNNCASFNQFGGYGLTLSTVNLVGGPSVKCFEVGDAMTNTVIRTNTFAMATLNIGNGTTLTGNVQLVNNFLNDNPFADGKTGEKLMVSNLHIKAASTLDVNALGVHVDGDLTIASDGWLDLNTGVVLADDSVVTNFYGVGNKQTPWTSYRDRVKDSSNSARRFTPIYVALDNKTYWQVSAARATMMMIK